MYTGNKVPNWLWFRFTSSIISTIFALFLFLFAGCEGTYQEEYKDNTDDIVSKSEELNIEKSIESNDASIDKTTGLPLPIFQDKVVHVSDETIVIYTGAISGRVLYYDKTPAYPCTVYLFDDTNPSMYSESIEHTYTNKNGYYIFDNLSSGVLSFDGREWKVSGQRTYSVYPISSISFIHDYYINYYAPHALADVFKHKVTIASTIFIPKSEDK